MRVKLRQEPATDDGGLAISGDCGDVAVDALLYAPSALATLAGGAVVHGGVVAASVGVRSR